MVPPLREYKSDLTELVPLLVSEYSAKSGKKVTSIPDEAWSELLTYNWPGNVRELRNAIERSVLLSRDGELNANWLNLNNTLLEEQLEEPDETPESTEPELQGDNVTALNVVQNDI